MKYYFKYVEGIEKPSTAALHVGKAVHAVLQEWNMQRWRGEQRDLKKLHESFENAWSEQASEMIWEMGREPREKHKALCLIHTYLEESPITWDERPEGVEVRLECDLSEHGLPKLVGIIDLVGKDGVIVDFKTTSQTPQPERVQHQTEVQMSCYALLYRESTGTVETGFELHHLVKLKHPKLVVTQLPSMSVQQETRLFRLLDSYVEGVSRQDYVPSLGLNCLGCQYFSECRRWS